MSTVQRAADVMLRPNQTWAQIDAEPATVRSIYLPYVVTMAALPCIAAFIGFSLIGVGGFGGFGISMRLPVMYGLTSAIIRFAGTLALIQVMAMLVNALAPMFGGVRDPLKALKIAAYASTSALVGGICALVPWLALLGVPFSLYSIYLVYSGLVPLMKCNRAQAIPYTAAIAVVGLLLGLLMVIGTTMILSSTASPMGGLGLGGGGDDLTINGHSVADMTRKLNDASRKMEQATQARDVDGIGKGAASALGALTGEQHEPLAVDKLRSFLPASVEGAPRGAVESDNTAIAGIPSTHCSAVYENGEKTVSVNITDTGGLAAIATTLDWIDGNGDSESDTETSKSFKRQGRSIHEQYSKDSSQAVVTTLLPNGTLVEVKGAGVGIDQVRRVVASMDLDALAAAKGTPK